jgi:hypothetical protein
VLETTPPESANDLPARVPKAKETGNGGTFPLPGTESLEIPNEALAFEIS